MFRKQLIALATSDSKKDELHKLKIEFETIGQSLYKVNRPYSAIDWNGYQSTISSKDVVSKLKQEYESIIYKYSIPSFKEEEKRMNNDILEAKKLKENNEDVAKRLKRRINTLEKHKTHEKTKLHDFLMLHPKILKAAEQKIDEGFEYGREEVEDAFDFQEFCDKLDREDAERKAERDRLVTLALDNDALKKYEAEKLAEYKADPAVFPDDIERFKGSMDDLKVEKSAGEIDAKLAEVKRLFQEADSKGIEDDIQSLEMRIDVLELLKQKVNN